MGLTPRQAATLFFGTSLFGLLTFTSGLMIGVGIGGAPSAPSLPAVMAVPMAGGAKAPAVAPVAATATAQAMAAPAPQAGGMSVVVVPMPKAAPAARAPAATAVASAPGAAPAATPASPAPEVSVAAAAAQPAPLAVKDFRVGLPLEVAPASPLRGPLVDAALAQPRSLTLTPAARAPDGAAGGAPAAAPAAAAAAPVPAPAAPTVAAAAPSPSAPPFLYSVQAGSFLIKENAERLAEALNKRGYAAQVLVAQRPGEPTWYPVVLAPVSDVATVARLAQEFSASEGHAAEVVSWLAAK